MKKRGAGGEDTAVFALSLPEDGSGLDRNLLKDCKLVLCTATVRIIRFSHSVFCMSVAALSYGYGHKSSAKPRGMEGESRFYLGEKTSPPGVWRVAPLWSCARTWPRPSTPPGSFAEMPSDPLAPTMALSSVTPLAMGGAFFSVGMNKQIAPGSMLSS